MLIRTPAFTTKSIAATLLLSLTAITQAEIKPLTDEHLAEIDAQVGIGIAFAALNGVLDKEAQSNSVHTQLANELQKQLTEQDSNAELITQTGLQSSMAAALSQVNTATVVPAFGVTTGAFTFSLGIPFFGIPLGL